MDGKVSPLLAESWRSTRRQSQLQPEASGVKFTTARPFDASEGEVQLRARRAEGSGPTRPRSRCSQHQPSRRPTRTHRDPGVQGSRRQLPVLHGEATAAILDPRARLARQQIPGRWAPALPNWRTGRRASITLVKNPDYRGAAAVKMKKVTGASSATRRRRWPRCWLATSTACRASARRRTCRSSGRQAVHGGHRRHRGQDHRRHQQQAQALTTCACAAPSAAIDRKAIVDGAMEGYGAPIGSHLVPSDAGLLSTTGASPTTSRRRSACSRRPAWRRR